MATRTLYNHFVAAHQHLGKDGETRVPDETDPLLGNDDDLEARTSLVSSLLLALFARGSCFLIGDDNLFPKVTSGVLLESPSGKCLQQTLICGSTSSSFILKTCSHVSRLSLSLGKR